MRNLKEQDGQIIIIAVVFTAVLLTLAGALMGYITQYTRAEKNSIASTQALHLAEAAVDKAIFELNQNQSYSGESGTSLGAGTFTVSVATSGSIKKITATGYVPNSTNPVAYRTIKVQASVNTSIVSFRYGVQVGEGGLTMYNGSQINGNLFSNGNAGGSGGGTVTGDLTVAGGTQPTPDQQWQTQNTDWNLGDVSSRANAAQSFVPTATNSLNKVALNLKKTGTPSDITIKIVTDNAGKPSKTVLATGSIPASNITTNYGFAEAAFSTTASLTSGTTYWIIAIASVNASNYFSWGMDNGDLYTSGTGKYSTNWNASTPVWNSVGGDLGFRTYMGGVNTSLSNINVGGNAWAHDLSSCTVGGNAFYQTISSCTVTGTQFPGSSDAAPAPMPISDAQIDEWKEIAEAGGVISGNYTINNSQTLGPKKIDGDLTVGIGGTISLSGPVWVKGNITFSNNSTLKVDASTGTSSAIILADYPGSESTKGTIYLSNNMTITGNGSANTYPMALSTNTGANAISLNNNASGVILYASQGTINVANNGAANQITAYKLVLNNNVVVNYINGLQNGSFSNGPGGSWAVIPGTYVITK